MGWLSELGRRMWIGEWLEAGAQDTRHAFRLLGRNPGFALVAVLSLALGIGANTVVFSALNALVLKPLPIRDPAHVVFLNNLGNPPQSMPNYRDFRDRNSSFEALLAYRIDPMALQIGEQGAQRVWGYLATGNYFQSLGIQPAIGRFFGPAEDAQTNASPYAVLSYATWHNRFAGDPGIVGKQIRINGAKYSVLGVAPRDFHGTELFYWPEVWVPMSMEPQIEGWNWLEQRQVWNAFVIGRLKPGVSPAQAETNLNSVAAQLAHDYKADEGMHLTLSPPGLVGEAGRDPARQFGVGVMLLAGLVLLAACANLASLLAARTADRARDLALRVSIGAGRGRIARQLLTEALWISLAGGAAGYAIALVLLRMISQWRAPLDFPVQFDVNPDWRVFGFACAAALLTGLLVGLASARRAWKVDPAADLKTQAGSPAGHGVTTRDFLLPVQVALCSVLLIASLVAARGLARSFHTPLGFQADGAAVLGFDLGPAGYSTDQGPRFEQRAADAVSRLPGVESVAYASSIPLSINQSTNVVYPENATEFRHKNEVAAVWYNVSPGYFRTSGTRLIAGREFTAEDTAGHPEVAVVNQTLARRVAGTENAVGHRFQFGDRKFVEIIGVVEDGKYESMTENPKAAYFGSILQSYSPTVVLIARSHRDADELARDMRATVAALDPQLPLYGVGSVRQMLGFVYLPMNAAAIALGSFGVLAVMLAVTGIYGLAAYSVSRRAREIGIRVAIGAQPAQVLRLVFGRTGVLVFCGAAIGLALGAAVAKLMSSIVYQASSRDPVVLILAVLGIALVALAAALGPARRALRIDPVEALRAD